MEFSAELPLDWKLKALQNTTGENTMNKTPIEMDFMGKPWKEQNKFTKIRINNENEYFSSVCVCVTHIDIASATNFFMIIWVRLETGPPE